MPRTSVYDASQRVPSKALKKTAPHFKMFCALVHASKQPGHVILSPGQLKAGAEYVVECLIRVVNHFIDQKTSLPPVLRVQLDSASVNRNHLVLCLLAEYCQRDLFRVCILQHLLQHHAHDLIVRGAGLCEVQFFSYKGSFSMTTRSCGIHAAD